jgi:hypothetical protein
MSAENPQTIESQANSNENASVLLFDRLSNPKIREQVINLLSQSEVWSEKNYTDSEPEVDEKGDIVRGADGEVLFVSKPYVALSRQQIEADYDKTLERIKSFTEIDFSSEEPEGGSVDSNEKMFLNFELPGMGKPTTKQWSIIEAHEKGHSMRPYHGGFFDQYFSKAFDLFAVPYTEDDYKISLLIREQNKDKMGDEPTSFEEQKEEFISYLFSGGEIAERMSQLKNYFGMKGDDQFTLDHLNYVREHYVLDTGLDNRMSHFLKAITPETEEEFVRLVNCSGI